MTTKHSTDARPLARARAREALYRLAAAAFGHPVPEVHEAFTDGRFHRVFDKNWRTISGHPWSPPQVTSPDFASFEAGYIHTFQHGRGGRPRVALTGGDYNTLLDGDSRSIFMLNVQSFYAHFGLRAATGDEGLQGQPDHLATMLEFMAVLQHLEAQARERRLETAAYQRAQRDFLQRCLLPLLRCIGPALKATANLDLDQYLVQLLADLRQSLEQQLTELQASVGPAPAPRQQSARQPPEATQILWN